MLVVILETVVSFTATVVVAFVFAVATPHSCLCSSSCKVTCAVHALKLVVSRLTEFLRSVSAVLQLGVVPGRDRVEQCL